MKIQMRTMVHLNQPASWIWHCYVQWTTVRGHYAPEYQIRQVFASNNPINSNAATKNYLIKNLVAE